MYLPSLQPVSNSDIYVNGDVTIHPSAVIAPGVILQAAPNSRIVIGAQVSLGMGVIINACQGTVKVEDGVTIGSGVLIIGVSTIGSNACIGTATTIFNTSVVKAEVIAPGSLLGDTSRQQQSTANTTNLSDQHGEIYSSADSSTQTKSTTSEVSSTTSEIDQKAETSASDSNPVEVKSADIEVDNNGSSPDSQSSSVVGQVYINQLLFTLFPHNRPNNKSKEDI